MTRLTLSCAALPGAYWMVSFHADGEIVIDNIELHATFESANDAKLGARYANAPCAVMGDDMQADMTEAQIDYFVDRINADQKLQAEMDRDLANALRLGPVFDSIFARIAR